MQIELWISLKAGMSNLILYFINHIHCWKKETGEENLISKQQIEFEIHCKEKRKEKNA